MKKRNRYIFFRYRYLGKQDKITIGNYPTLTLKKAREDVAKWQVILANGDNPKTVKNLIIKEKITELTFEELFRKWYSVIFESKISAPLILRSFEIHVFPHFGKYPISAITIHNCLSLLDNLSSG
ncbi:integrase arm-type DNA-binding domain-containing protein [Arsenophonus sp. PmNCSU2021_1]|uniref:integrase arm-type DNA-binding domain-containing protein n=1 Tax=Arsenophonus sp. PmNCSU2021_1 TaxID=3118989 RepID=UPI003FA5F543